MNSDISQNGQPILVTNFIDDIEALNRIGGRVIYREYASLIFQVIVEKETESELAVLDLIRFIVEVLDKQFGNNVCELDLVFNPEKLHFILDEMILDGIVISTDVDETCANLDLRREAISME